jgi:hypothetical protein
MGVSFCHASDYHVVLKGWTKISGALKLWVLLFTFLSQIACRLIDTLLFNKHMWQVYRLFNASDVCEMNKLQRERKFECCTLQDALLSVVATLCSAVWHTGLQLLSGYSSEVCLFLFCLAKPMSGWYFQIGLDRFLPSPYLVLVLI